MQVTRDKQHSGFYSDAVLLKGGRPVAINAVNELVDDYELLIVDCQQKIAELQDVIRDQANGIYKGRPPSKLEAMLSNSVLLDELNYLQQLKLACSHNLQACFARLKELRA